MTLVVAVGFVPRVWYSGVDGMQGTKRAVSSVRVILAQCQGGSSRRRVWHDRLVVVVVAKAVT